MFKMNTCAESHCIGAIKVHVISKVTHGPSGSLLHSEKTVIERLTYEDREVLKNSKYNLSMVIKCLHGRHIDTLLRILIPNNFL